MIENKTFDEINVGDSATLTRTLTENDIQSFAAISGDVNPAHVDEEYAQSDMFHKIIAHGMWGGALVSTVLGTELPGPGTIYLDQSLQFLHPIAIGDTVTVKVTALEKNTDKKQVLFDCSITNQHHQEVLKGKAFVIAPTEKVKRKRVDVPQLVFRRSGQLYEELLSMVHQIAPIKTAVVHPTDEVSLLGAIESAKANLIDPILIGQKEKITAVAKKLKVDLSAYRIIDAPHSHASAELAVSLAREGKVGALMKGAIHTDELMHAALRKDKGITTDRRMSHVFLMDVPSYSKLLLISDAAININPTLDEKKDIVQNAIDLARVIGIESPKVAILAAVETVSEKLQSTIDAAALCKMADRNQIKGGILDGPLAFDNAISKEAARIKGVSSKVAGDVDIMITPDLVSGNILVKQLEYLSNAQGAAIVLGARVPIILTSRSDSSQTRLTSCALAALWVHNLPKVKGKRLT